MKYYIITGEPSGDLHGSNLMHAIQSKDENADFRFWGGDHMLAIAPDIVTHIRETSIMGFVEVVKQLPRILSFFKKAKQTILDYQPDRIVLIDYPGFNLRMAEWCKKNGFHVSYYISPQLWAWKKGRVKKVQQFVDEMIVILPFEEEFYRSFGVEVHYVGHPLLPVIEGFKACPEFYSKYKLDKNKNLVALLPGSRKQEIRSLLPIYLAALKELKTPYQAVLAMAPNIEVSFYQQLIGPDAALITLIENDTYNVLSHADAAIVTSGTATLETALFEVPQVIGYKTSDINYQIGKWLVNLEFISLVNLILGRGLVPELIQGDLSASSLAKHVDRLLRNPQKVKHGYQELKNILQQDEDPSLLAASVIMCTS